MQTYQYDEIINVKYHLAPYQGNELCEYFFENWSLKLAYFGARDTRLGINLSCSQSCEKSDRVSNLT